MWVFKEVRGLDERDLPCTSASWKNYTNLIIHEAIKAEQREAAGLKGAVLWRADVF